jgi:hypothetical protein
MCDMQCVEFENRVNRLLDNRLSPDDDDELADHARDCEGCASLLHAQHVLFAGLHAGRVAAPVDLADRVVSRRHTEITRSRTTWRNVGWAVLLASAAGLAGLAVMALQSRNPQRDLVKAPTPESPSTKPATLPGLAVGAVGLHQKVEPKHSEKSKAEFDEYFVVLENFATQISDSKEFDEVSESLEPGIKPIRSSFGLAIDALWRTLPRGRERTNKPDAGASFLPEPPSLS